MATTTSSVTLSATAYTALTAAGVTPAMITSQELPVQIVVATSLPAVGTANWFPLDEGNQLILNGLGASDIVYALPSGSDARTRTVKVMVQ